MKWYEPIIAICAILAVVLPFYFKIRGIKKGKINKCSGACCCCEVRDKCLKNFKEYVRKERNKNNLSPLSKKKSQG